MKNITYSYEVPIGYRAFEEAYLKALNNPAVQGMVAVSDSVQLEKIRKHAEQVPNLGVKLKYWDYKKVLEVHDALEMVNESINSLGLVPQGF